MQNILICDDHSIVRRGLRNILSANFSDITIEESSTISETLNSLKTNKPDYAILDLQLGDGNMLDNLYAILNQYPKLKLLVYSMCNEDVFGKRVLQIGARGFLTKDSDESEIIRALQLFLSGQNYLSPRLNTILINSLQHKKTGISENPFAYLSNREVEVSQHLLAGKSLKEISSKMQLHANTIVTYKKRIFKKLEVKNIIELNKMAQLYHFE